MKHNTYYQDKVQSLSLAEQEGPATVGVIEPGHYSFSTSSEERMTLIAGAMKAMLPGEDWKSLHAGEGFLPRRPRPPSRWRRLGTWPTSAGRQQEARRHRPWCPGRRRARPGSRAISRAGPVLRMRALLQDVGPVGHFQGLVGVLLHQEDGLAQGLERS